MKAYLITALQIVLGLAVVMLIYYVVPWLLGMLGLTIPERIWTVVMVILGLIAVIGALRGGYDGFWTGEKK